MVSLLNVVNNMENKTRIRYVDRMEEGRKRVLAIIAGILVARHLKSTDDLLETKPSPRTEALVGSAVQWAEKIMRKIDNVFAGNPCHVSIMASDQSVVSD